MSLFTSDKSYFISKKISNNHWTPDESQWDSLKYLSNYNKVLFKVQSINGERKSEKLSFSISKDTVGAPILYRQMPIPSLLAERNLDSMSYKLIDIGSKNPPHIAMKGFTVCGNWPEAAGLFPGVPHSVPYHIHLRHISDLCLPVP